METDDLRSLKGVGPSVEDKLKNLDIFNQTDLLFHLPSRYEDRTTIKKIGALKADIEAQVEGEILLSSIVFRGRRMLMVQISDGTGIMTMRFFTFNKYQKNAFEHADFKSRRKFHSDLTTSLCYPMRCWQT